MLVKVATGGNVIMLLLAENTPMFAETSKSNNNIVVGLQSTATY